MDADNPDLNGHHVSKRGAGRRFSGLQRAVRGVSHLHNGVGADT